MLQSSAYLTNSAALFQHPVKLRQVKVVAFSSFQTKPKSYESAQKSVSHPLFLLCHLFSFFFQTKPKPYVSTQKSDSHPLCHLSAFFLPNESKTFRISPKKCQSPSLSPFFLFLPNETKILRISPKRCQSPSLPSFFPLPFSLFFCLSHLFN